MSSIQSTIDSEIEEFEDKKAREKVAQEQAEELQK